MLRLLKTSNFFAVIDSVFVCGLNSWNIPFVVRGV